ncbi:ABC transporter substrate-binding protein [Pseudomonas sp. M47T1]|nr:ABC transporter substrate-binding protein [Pseudomonas sp. M47T1]EIK95454.1 ABC transporter substrate-binding protein [Pseudomonas sp. M47T1]
MKPAFALLALAAALPALAAETPPAFNLSPQQAHIDAPRNPAAIAQIPPGFAFAEPGKFTVAIAGASGPPLALLASDDKSTIGSEADTARLIADSLGLELKVVQTSWEDWPLGVSSGKYDAVLSNVTVTESRKKRFDFATYRQDVLGFYVKSGSSIASIKEAKDVAGLKVVVGSGTNQEKVLLAWSEANEKAGLEPTTPVYLDDQAAATLAVQSGRVDAIFAPNSLLSYIATTRGGIKQVGLVNGGWPLKADIAVTTRKGNGLVASIQTALEGTIAGGQYASVLQRWGLDAERIDHSQINPPGLPD